MLDVFLLLSLTLFPGAGMTPPDVSALSCLDRSFTSGTYVEEPVVILSRGVRLSGRLMRPNQPGHHPGVVLIPGGGQSRRLNYPTRYVATRLAHCGIAAIVYDKRSTGRSEGDWETATFEDLIADAEAALAVLRGQPGVDTTQIGLVGLSQGGRFAPVVAARTGQVHFIATASAPFVPPRETRLYALARALDGLPYAPTHRHALQTLWEDFLRDLEAGISTRALDARIERLAFVPEALRPPRSDAVAGNPLFNSLSQDHAEEWRGLDLPFLALYGERDAVVPVAASAERLRELLGGGLEVVVVPEVDHSFVYPNAWHQRFRFEDVVVAWILAHTGRVDACGVQLAIEQASGPSPAASAACQVY